MTIIATILKILFVIDCIALTVVVLLQEGKSYGLGSLGGQPETYWGQNKGRSLEGTLVKLTRIMVIAFLVIAALLNLKVFL